jgi:hypothetical protein
MYDRKTGQRGTKIVANLAKYTARMPTAFPKDWRRAAAP